MTMLERVKNLTEKECIVDVLRKELADNKCKNCGKCTFGYEGATQIEMILNDIGEKKGRPGDLELLADLCSVMKDQSMCEDGDDIALAILEALEKYRKDLEDHVSRKSCRAGVCKRFMTYHIIAGDCTGCGDCLDACPEDAILGRKKFVHVINQAECTQCGACKDACDEDAIVLAGAVKPRCPLKPIPCRR